MYRTKSLQNSWEKLKKSNRLVTVKRQKIFFLDKVWSFFPSCRNWPIWLGSHGGYGRQVVGGCQQCRQFHFIPYFPSIISSLFPRQLFLLHYILLLIVKGLNILLPQNYPFLSLYVLLLILESNNFLLQKFSYFSLSLLQWSGGLSFYFDFIFYNFS